MASKDQPLDAPDGHDDIELSLSSEDDTEKEPSFEELCAQKSEEIECLQKELEELKEKQLRREADLDNYRKRLLREKNESIQYSNKQLLLDIISIIDDFERAIKSSESTKDFDCLHDGIVMIEKRFSDMLEHRWDLIGFGAEGEEFDPERHEAIMVEEQSDIDDQLVLQVFQQGYMLKNSVLRTAKVKVSQPPSLENKENRDNEEA